MRKGKINMILCFLLVPLMLITSGRTEDVKEQNTPNIIKFPPHDVSDFKELLLQSDIFIDKSLLIKQFLNITEGGPIVINQPIGWGKSMNLDMLRRFFELEVDHQGIELPDVHKINKKLFLGGNVDYGNRKKTLKRLKICTHSSIMENYRGKFPVIYFSLKNIFHESYYKTRTLLAEKLVNLYTKDFLYLKKYCSNDDDTFINVNRTELQNYFDRKVSAESNYSKALYLLSYLLEEHFKRKVMLFIDDYDEPLHHARQKFCNESSKFIKYLDLITNLLAPVINGNPHLERACLTGIFPYHKFDDRLDMLRYYKIPQEEFSEYYGFTEKEVNELLGIIPIKTKPEDIKSWYNGFYIAGQTIYNPVSVLECLKNDGKLQHNFIHDNRLDFLEGETLATDDFELGFQRFLGNNSRFFFYAIEPTDREVTTREPTKNVYFYLLFGGYISVYEGDDVGYMYLAIPNYQAMRMYSNIQLKWTTNVFEFPNNWQVGPASLLGHYKMKEFEKEMQTLLNASIILNKLDIRKEPDHKLIYNGLMISLAFSMPPDFLLVCQTSSDFVTKIVVLFIPSVTSEKKDGIIMQYDFVSKKNASLAEFAEAAAKKIEISEYASQLTPFPYLENIYKLCIMFRHREIAVGEDKVPFNINQQVYEAPPDS